MKNLLLLILIFFAFSKKMTAQESIHWLINQDLKTDCNYLKTGVFINKETGQKTTEGYTIEFSKDYVLEKFESGKYYVKSILNFTSECNYELIINETNNSDLKEFIGQKIYGEIMETATIDKLVKIKVKMGENTLIVIFEKL